MNISLSHRNSNNQKSAYRKIKPLGEGTFGKVYMVQEVSTKTIYVSKEIKLTNLDVY
jgi:serine/threonine protein kinase